MIGLARSAIIAARLKVMRRRQFDNERLRSYFRINYGIEVGLFSYGCFDRWRMPGPMQVGRYCSISSTTRSVLQNHPMVALTTHPILYESAFGLVENDLPPPAPLFKKVAEPLMVHSAPNPIASSVPDVTETEPVLVMDAA